jgi:hypothetical protein
MTRRKPELYQYRYLHNLPPHKVIWVVKEGDYLTIAGCKYLAVQVIRSPIPGEEPKLVLQPCT